jgi:hypothetical protein
MLPDLLDGIEVARVSNEKEVSMKRIVSPLLIILMGCTGCGTVSGPAEEEKSSVRYFAARTPPELVWQAPRLRNLEVLVGVDGQKNYESLLDMDSSQWDDFAEILKSQNDSQIMIRWKERGKVTERPLSEMLPWAKPDLRKDIKAVYLGGTRDETANRRLPPHESRVDIGIVMK